MTDHEAKMLAHQRLADRVAAAHGHPAVGDLYCHYKTADSGDPLDLYEVIMVGIDEDTLVQRVGYFSRRYGTHQFRTLDSWNEPVVTESGSIRPRFFLARGR